ncbi:hypothetical protein UlMin_044807 [Ulmus minor]
MTNGREDTGAAAAGGFHRVQAERDLESNWEVDLARKLEEYLLKICSGEIPTEAEGHIPINFAEAALLLQGSVQVYSRKVEYLYSLVLRALEFLSQKRQQEQLEGTSAEPQESGSKAVADEENDLFWGLDDIPVEAKNCLDITSDKDAPLNYFVKPPANLVVLEGDCLDSSGDAGELESYLLATSDVYRGFILLDPCDAVAVHDYVNGEKTGKGQNSAYKGSTNRKGFESVGGSHKSSRRKNLNAQSPLVDCSFEGNNCNVEPDPPASTTFYDDNNGFGMDDRDSEPRDFDDSDDDDDDPWKPLNPHEPGKLKVKPFRKVKSVKRNGANSTKQVSLSTLFPPARLQGTISPELTRMWEVQSHERKRESQSPPLYEKLRQSLINGGNETFDAFFNADDGNDENEYHIGTPDLGQPDDDMPDMHMDEDLPFHNEKHDVDGVNFGMGEDFGHDDPNNGSLEDLCRSHLDALLASIAETEKQSELAARVSTWKQKIEHNLEEQDSHPEFDIQKYGDRILDKLSLDADNRSVLSFADVVEGQEKYDVARSFSALLQLVNNGNVELDRNGAKGKSVCYTSVNPFHVRLLSQEKRREVQFGLSSKRVKSPTKKACKKGDNRKFATENAPPTHVKLSPKATRERPTQPNCKMSVKVEKHGGARCTPESKRRRRSRLVEPVDLH